jgi:hypothetical protein
MAQEDIQLAPLQKELAALVRKYEAADSINALDQAGSSLAPAMTREEIAAAVKAYKEAMLHMGLSCQQLVLGIRIKS